MTVQVRVLVTSSQAGAASSRLVTPYDHSVLYVVFGRCAGEAASCGRLLAMALGLAEMEMALQGLSTSHHTEAPGQPSGLSG